MKRIQPGKMLRCHFSEQDRHKDQPLYEAIVKRCRDLGIAGVTVFRGLEGFGESAEIYRSHLLTHELPIVVTVVDTEANIQRLLPALEEMMDTGVIAISDAEVVRVQKSLLTS